MTIDAAAQALATDPAVSEDVAPKMTEDQELEALFDAANTKENPEQEQPAEEAPQESEEQEAEDQTTDDQTDEADDQGGDPEKHETKVEAPTELPKSIRDSWGDIPESARDAILTSQREMNRKLSDQGRQMQGISPIRDVLVEMAKDTPEMMNMRPEQVAQEIRTFRENVIKPLEADPVNTVLRVIKERGLAEPIMQAMQGQQPQQGSMALAEVKRENEQLRKQLQQVADPEYIGGIVQQHTTQAKLADSVNEFSQQAEHWGEVESHMPHAIEFVKNAQPDLPPQDILARAYDLAVSQFVPEDNKATQIRAAEQAAQEVDPAKTEAAIKAKSVNVKSTSQSKGRKLTEDEELARVFDKMKE